MKNKTIKLPVSAANQHLGPVGAQSVPLTAGRSIAVDSRSIPYATPLWLVSDGAGAPLQLWALWPKDQALP